MKEWLEPLFEKASLQIGLCKKWLDGTRPVFIYGTGTFAKDVLRGLMEKGVYVTGFLDHREAVPAFLSGIPVLNPQAATDSVVVIGIHNRDADVLRITHRLSEVNARQVISPVELFDLLGDCLGNRYWLTRRDFYFPYKGFIEKARGLLKDDASRELYSSIIEFRLTGNYAALPKPDFENQYFSKDIPGWKTPLRMVDCGAFDGDTLSAFIRAGIKIESLAAFEPDNINFSKLSHFVSKHNNELSDAILYPCGVYQSTTQLFFEIGQGEASSASVKGSTVVQCVSLDDVIPTFAPTLIKMDIEGAEYEALLGARYIINSYLPGLALSIYHRPEHLWQIPLLVNDIALGRYDFYLRPHAMSTFDTVLYCIPNRL